MEKNLTSLIDIIIENLGHIEVLGSDDKVITDVTADSRVVIPGSLFICLKGATVDGHKFLKSAVEKGAVAALVEDVPEEIPVGVTLLKVEDTRVAMEVITPFFFDYPGKQMRMIGLTGTNGKTTTTNIVRAILRKAGFKVGVYVYSQAINDEEALEEARIVIDNLKPYMLDLPVVYDPEFVFYDEARTDMVSEDVFCRNTQLFLDAVEAEGFKTMIYANLMWEFFVFTPELLRRNDIWFAQYSKKPTSPYKFTFWQYSGASQIEGVETPCDMNVWFIPNEEIWEDPIMPDSPILEGSPSPESTDLDEDVILDESAGSQMVEYESPAVPLP